MLLLSESSLRLLFCLRIFFTKTNSTNNDTRNSIWITVWCWTTIFQITTFILTNLTRNSNRCTTICNACIELIDLKPQYNSLFNDTVSSSKTYIGCFMSTSQSSFIISTITFNMSSMTYWECRDCCINSSTNEWSFRWRNK